MMNDSLYGPVLTPKEFAQALKVSRKHFDRHARNDLAIIRTGGKI
jgi:hypothetical protein